MNKGECSWLHQTNPQRFVPGVAQASSCLHGTPLPGVGCRLHDGTVITHYKRRGTIESIFHQQELEGGFEVIVADGMSNDGTRALVTRLAVEHPSLRLIDNPGRIVSTGLNQAIRQATGQFIVRNDAHTKYAPDYLKTCVEVLETHRRRLCGRPVGGLGHQLRPSRHCGRLSVSMGGRRDSQDTRRQAETRGETGR